MVMEDILREEIPLGKRLDCFQNYLHRLLGVTFVDSPSIPGTSIFSHEYGAIPQKGDAELRELRSRYQAVVSEFLTQLGQNLGSLGLLELDVLLEPLYLTPPPQNSHYGCVPSLLALIGMTLEPSALDSTTHISERATGLRSTLASSRSEALLSGFITPSYHSLDTFLGDEREYRVACRVLGVQPSEGLLHKAIERPLSEYITEMTDLDSHPLTRTDFVSVSSPLPLLGSAIVPLYASGTADELLPSDGKPSYLCAPLESMLVLLHRVAILDEPGHHQSNVTLFSGALGALREYIDAVALYHDLSFGRISQGLLVSQTNAPVYRALCRTFSEGSRSLQPN